MQTTQNYYGDVSRTGTTVFTVPENVRCTVNQIRLINGGDTEIYAEARANGIAFFAGYVLGRSFMSDSQTDIELGAGETLTVAAQGEGLRYFISTAVQTCMEPRGLMYNIDAPVPDSVITDSLTVFGWGLYSADGQTDGIASVSVSVGPLGADAVRYCRQDVEAAITGYPDYRNCGFSAVIDTSSLTPGAYELSIDYYDAESGLIRKEVRSLTKTEPATSEFRSYLDCPRYYDNIDGTLTVGGWAVYARPNGKLTVGDVDVTLGGVSVKAEHFEREDIRALYPGYSDYSKTGFAAEIGTNFHAPGMRQLSVTVWDSGHTTRLFTYKVPLIKAGTSPFSLPLDLIQGETFDLVFVLEDVSPVSGYNYLAKYDATAMSLEETFSINAAHGGAGLLMLGGDIGTGEAAVSGGIALVRFKALRSGAAEISFDLVKINN